MNQKKAKMARPVILLIAAFALVVGASSLVGCGDDESGTGVDLENHNNDNNDNQNTNNQEPEYDAGAMDGTWELRWRDADQTHFSTLTIEHNLDDDTLVVEFDTPYDGEGTFRSVDFEEDFELSNSDQPRQQGRFSGEWRPHPDDEFSNEEYTMVFAIFKDEAGETMEGEISASVGTNMPVPDAQINFDMEFVEPEDDDDDEEHEED